MLAGRTTGAGAGAGTTLRAAIAAFSRSLSPALSARSARSSIQSPAETPALASATTNRMMVDFCMRASSGEPQECGRLYARGQSARLVTRLELSDYLVERNTARAQQHQHVEQQVSRLLDDFLFGFANTRKRELHAFLTHFLRHARDAFVEQTRGVARLGFFGRALRDDALELREKRNPRGGASRFIAEAGEGAVVTRRAARACRDQQSIVVAVEREPEYVERVAGGLTLFPQPLLAAAEEHGATARDRLLQCLAVHVRHHEHGAAVGILHDGRYQAFALGEIDVRRIERGVHRRISMPEAASVVLRSGMAIAPE